MVVDPAQPDLPARVSLLIFPARGTVARLLEPRVASAVFGSDDAEVRIDALRGFRGSGWRRGSDMSVSPSMAESYSRPQGLVLHEAGDS